MKPEQRKITAIAALLAGSVIVGFSFVVLKAGLPFASPFTILTDRLLIALLVLFLLKKTGMIAIETISKGQRMRVFFLSLLYPIAFFLFQNFGIKYISASEASIIYSLIPVLTTIASAIVLKERTSGIQWFGILLSFCGMAYISIRMFKGFSDSAPGYLLVLCSTLSMVLYYVFLKKNVARVSPVSITYYLISYAVASSVLVYYAWELINFQTLPDLHRLEHTRYVMAILYLSILSTLGTSLLTTIGIKNLSAVQASIFSNISPFFGILAGVLVMGDVLQTYQIAGAICIFTGMFISLKKQ